MPLAHAGSGGFVVRLSGATGATSWWATAGSLGTTSVRAVTVDSSGTVIAGWSASPSANFGGGTVTTNNTAIVSYNGANGTLMSVDLVDDAGAFKSLSLASTGGSIRVATKLDGTVDLGSGPIIPTGYEVLVFSMVGGTVEWIARGAPAYIIANPKIAVSTSGATFVGSSYDGPFTFGAESLASYGGSSDAFIAKLAP